jgi:peroxiredoxin
MKKRLACVLAAALIGMGIGTSNADQQPLQVGGGFPDIKMVKPADSDDLKYLGLSGSGTFSVEDIKAQALIIQIFSMYCPYCQKDAPNVNRLFDLIEKTSHLKGKIKMIGIGAGNSSFEVKTFKRKYQVEFPLIPDGDFKIHRLIGEVRTPYFIVLKMRGQKKPEIVFSKLGAHESIDAFLGEVIRLTDIR